MTTELTQIINEVQLAPDTAALVQSSFENFFPQIEQWNTTAKTLVVTDVSQRGEMKMAREGRLALAKVRKAAERTKDELKRDATQYNKAVQGVYNLIVDKIKPIEEYLKEQEQFEERQEQKRIAALNESRWKEMEPFKAFVQPGINLGAMPAAQWSKFYDDAEAAYEQDQEDQRRRQEQLKAEREEQARLRAENARLQKEQARRDDRIRKMNQTGFMYNGTAFIFSDGYEFSSSLLDASERDFENTYSLAYKHATEFMEAEEIRKNEEKMFEKQRQDSLIQRLLDLGLTYNGLSFKYHDRVIFSNSVFQLEDENIEQELKSAEKKIADIDKHIQDVRLHHQEMSDLGKAIQYIHSLQQVPMADIKDPNIKQFIRRVITVLADVDSELENMLP